mgnify:CR=1 FL=1
MFIYVIELFRTFAGEFLSVEKWLTTAADAAARRTEIPKTAPPQTAPTPPHKAAKVKMTALREKQPNAKSAPAAERESRSAI